MIRVIKKDAKITPSGNSGVDFDADEIIRAMEREIAITVADFENDIYTTLGSNAHATTHGSKSQPTHNRIERKVYVPETDDSDNDGIEEVKFTHEIDHEDASIAINLKEKFESLRGQVTEFKSRYLKATEKLKEAENKVTELQEKVDEFEEEKHQWLSNNTNTTAGRVVRPQNMATKDFKGDDIRKALLNAEDGNELMMLDSLQRGGKAWKWTIAWKTFVYKMTPFKKDVRKIQARFGSSVAAYFLFFRYLFIQFSFIASIAAIFTILHLRTVISRGGSLYSVLTSGRGLLPGFMLFSSFDSSEQMKYSVMVVSFLLFSVISLLNKLVIEDRICKQIDQVESLNSNIYAKEVLCSWDFSLTNEQEAVDLSGSLTQLFAQMLEESRESGMKKSKTNLDLIILYSRRVLATLLYVAVQVISFTLIILVTVYTQDITEAFKHIPFIRNLSSIVAPAILNAINAATPMAIDAITKLEQWDSGNFENNMKLLRVFLSSTLNIFLLAFSYFLLADPMLMAEYPFIRSRLEISYSGVFECRMDQAADGLFQLVFFSFVINIAVKIMGPIASIIVSKILGKPFAKSEFDIANSFVNLLSFLCSILLSLPFAPLSLIFVPIYFFVELKWERFTTILYQSKPKRPWKAHRAGLIFSKLYVISLFLLGIPTIVFFLTSRTFPKNCTIQDKHVGLCLTPLGDSTTSSNICVTDPQSKYYVSYGGSLSNYPASICESACGPFVNCNANITPFKTAIYDVTVLRTIWMAAFEYPYIPWFATIFLIVFIMQRTNTVRAERSIAEQQQRALVAQIQSLEAEQRKQTKLISKMKAIEEASRSQKNRI